MYIHLKVKAGSKKEVFEKVSEDHFTVSLKEKAERNMANKKACELVAEYFKIPIGKVRMISGHHSPSKILSLEIV